MEESRFDEASYPVVQMVMENYVDRVKDRDPYVGQRKVRYGLAKGCSRRERNACPFYPLVEQEKCNPQSLTKDIACRDQLGKSFLTSYLRQI